MSDILFISWQPALRVGLASLNCDTPDFGSVAETLLETRGFFILLI